MTRETGLEVSVEQRGDVVILRPVGDVDLNCSPTLRAELIQAQEAKPSKLIVDLAEVHYMDSSGVATLVEAMKGMRQLGGALVLCSLQERVLSIFEIARLDIVFNIVADLEAALQD
ncbi:MAG: STAS domain-containing protein [Phycisphaerales bacterium JB038]